MRARARASAGPSGRPALGACQLATITAPRTPAALLGFCDAAERGLLVDIARWAVEAGLPRLRTGMLHPAKRHLPLLDDPAALWFRPLSALAAPDLAFTDLLGEHSGYRYAGFSPGPNVAELTLAVAQVGALDEAQLAAWHGRHHSPGQRPRKR